MITPIRGLPLLGRFLDTRSEVESCLEPYSDSVCIPFSELADRTSELPPRHEKIIVAAGEPLLSESLALLSQLGREAEGAKPIPTGSWELRRLWSPNEFLSSVLTDLPPGRAVDLGCGAGRETCLLAASGWETLGIDHDAKILQTAERLCGAYAPDSGVRFAASDALAPSPEPGSYDLACALFFHHTSGLENWLTWLHPKGLLVIESFSESRTEAEGRPKDPITESRLLDLPATLEFLDYVETPRGQTLRAVLKKK